MSTTKKLAGNRHSIRLPHYDYSNPGSYFITICTHQHECLLGEIKQAQMELNALGKIVQQQWQDITHRFPRIEIDKHVVMPNHTHAIITIVGAPLAGALPLAPTLGNIVGAFKSLCFHHCLQWMKQHKPGKQLGKLWQRNYYDHVIRSPNDYDRIAEYIQNNPQQWELDSLNPDNNHFRSLP